MSDDFKLDNYRTPVPRKLMDKAEINWCEKQVHIGNMIKGVSDDRQKSVVYYADDKALLEKE